MKIEQKINQWLEQKFINPQQAEQILQFEQSSSKAHASSRGLYAFLILGVSVVALGIISLIAANWEIIPANLKLTLAFALLLGLGLGVYRTQVREHTIIFDVLSAAFLLSCLATIGLISQVFHTGGEIYQALTLWLLISLPLALLGKKQFLPMLWVTGLLATFLVWALNEKSWWAMQFLAREDSRFMIFDSNLFLLFPTVVLGTFLLANLSAFVPKLQRFQRSFDFWALAASLAAIVAGDVYCTVHETASRNALYPVYFLLPLTLSTLMIRPRLERSAKILLGLFLGLALLVYLPTRTYEQYTDIYRHSYELWGAVYFILSATLLALYFAVRKNFGMFNLMTIVIGLRFLIVYFQVFKNLASTGIGLVLSGLLIIGLTVLWYKTRHRLETWARSLFV